MGFLTASACVITHLATRGRSVSWSSLLELCRRLSLVSSPLNLLTLRLQTNVLEPQATISPQFSHDRIPQPLPAAEDIKSWMTLNFFLLNSDKTWRPLSLVLNFSGIDEITSWAQKVSLWPLDRRSEICPLTPTSKRSPGAPSSSVQYCKDEELQSCSSVCSLQAGLDYQDVHPWTEPEF